ncbi:MAG: asparagine synthase-related protein, partial [Candidatus Altarchaeaceae archaeon]
MFSYNLTDILKNLENLLVNSIKECLNENLNVGVVLSGGVDSTTIAFVLKKIYKNFILYTCGSKNSEDVKIVKKLISEINDSSLNFKIIEIDEEKIKENLENLRKILRE